MMVWGPDWEFSKDNGVNTPTPTSAKGSLATTESQDTRLISHMKDRNLHRAITSKDQPCLASEASQQWDGGCYAADNNGGDVWPIQHPSVVRGNYNIIYIKYMASHQ